MERDNQFIDARSYAVAQISTIYGKRMNKETVQEVFDPLLSLYGERQQSDWDEAISHYDESTQSTIRSTFDMMLCEMDHSNFWRRIANDYDHVIRMLKYPDDYHDQEHIDENYASYDSLDNGEIEGYYSQSYLDDYTVSREDLDSNDVLGYVTTEYVSEYYVRHNEVEEHYVPKTRIQGKLLDKLDTFVMTEDLITLRKAIVEVLG